MPFNPPFKSTFRAGDLIYGIRDERTQLVMALGVAHVQASGDFARAPMTVDQLDIEKSQTIPESVEMWRRFHADIGKHRKYQTYTRVTNNGQISDIILQTTDYNPYTVDSAIRRKCKFGLYWTIKNKFHIHFCLDGLRMAQITRKNSRTDEPAGRKPTEDEGKLRAVTGAELRWIYRHRNVVAVREHVQFWQNNRPVGPPWDEPERQEVVDKQYVRWRDLWASYKPSKLAVQLELDTDELREEQRAKVKSAARALRAARSSKIPLRGCAQCGIDVLDVDAKFCEQCSAKALDVKRA